MDNKARHQRVFDRRDSDNKYFGDGLLGFNKMILFIQNIVGFIMAHKRAFIALAGVLLLVLIIIGFRSCGGSAPSIDEKEIQQQQQEIQKRNDEQLQKNLDKSNEVLGKAENSTRQVEANTKEATNKNYSNTSADELKRKGKEVYK